MTEQISNLRRSIARMLFESGVLSLDDAAEFAHETRERFSASVEVSGRKPEVGSGPDPLISVVVPFLNEMENLSALEQRLNPVLEPLGDFEVIFVDDGSTDQSANIVLQMREQNPSIKLLRLSRNFGHQAALSAGMDHARGKCVVLMDADLQDPPELLPELIAKWRQGNEVVYAVRKKRKESIPKRLAYHSFYRLLRAVADIEIPLGSGDFCLMDRRVVESINALPERTRFLRGLRTWVGFRQTAVPYDRPARRAGEVKYSSRKLMKLALDGLFTLSSAPLRVATYLGALTAMAGVVYLVVALVARLTTGGVPKGWTSIIAIVLILGGAQLFVMSILGQYLSRVYDETKRRPLYLVVDRHGL